MANESLLDQMGNECLRNALILLKKEAVPTAGTVETAKGLVEMAFLSITLIFGGHSKPNSARGLFRAGFFSSD